MNIYRQELRQMWKTALVWLIAICSVLAFYGLFFPTVRAEGGAFVQLLKAYPPEVMKAFGIVLDQLTGWNGYYAFISVFVLLCGAIQALTLGMGVTSKESTRKTLDFLFTKPRSRTSILAGKALAVLTLITLTSAVFMAFANSFAAGIGGDYPVKTFMLMSSALFFVQLLFAALGLFIGCIVRRMRSPGIAATGIVFGFYAVSVLNKVMDVRELDFISFLTLFDSDNILLYGAYDWPSFWCSLGYTALFSLLAFVVLNRKDLHA